MSDRLVSPAIHGGDENHGDMTTCRSFIGSATRCSEQSGRGGP